MSDDEVEVIYVGFFRFLKWAQGSLDFAVTLETPLPDLHSPGPIDSEAQSV